jgi:hypothetical protein
MGCTACTEPQCLYKGALYFTVELYLYSPYGPYGLYRASLPVQGCTLPYSRAIPLLPLWAVRTVQSLIACTRVHFTSTFLYVIVQCRKNNPCGENLHCGDPLTVQPSKIVQTVTPPASSDSLVSLHYHPDSTRRISCHMKFCVVHRNPERVRLSVNGLTFGHHYYRHQLTNFHKARGYQLDVNPFPSTSDPQILFPRAQYL